jgi:hypothetical protein
MPFDPSTATAEVEAPAGGFDPSTAKPDVSQPKAFDPSTAMPLKEDVPAKPARDDTPDTIIRAAPSEDDPLNPIGAGLRAVRRALSPLIGKTEEQQRVQEAEKKGFEKQLPSVAGALENAGGSEIEKKGFLGGMMTNKAPWALAVNDGEAVREKGNPLSEVLLSPKEKDDPTSLKIAKALYTPIAGTINALTSPVGLATAGIGSGAEAIAGAKSGLAAAAPDFIGATKLGGESAPLLKQVEGAVAGIFASDMGRGLAESLPDAYHKWADPKVDTQEKIQAGVEIALNASMAGLAGLGAYHGLKPADVAGMRPIEAVKALAEASGKTVEEVAADAHKNFEEIIGKPEGVPKEAAPAFDPSTAQPDVSSPDVMAPPSWRYEIWKPEGRDRVVNVTRFTPGEQRIAESRSLADWQKEHPDLPVPHEDMPENNYSDEQVRAFEPRETEMVAEQDAQYTPVGLGAATREEMTPQPSITGIKNADIDAHRVARGLPPLMDTARRGWGKVWEQAMGRIDEAASNGEDAANEIIARQLDKPESLSDVEQAVLLHRRIDLKNQYDRVASRLVEGHEIGSEVTIASDRLRLAQLEDQLQNLEQANKAGGAESGRGLAARKMMAREDFSLVNMRLRKRANKGGAPLTEAESAEVEAAHKKIVATQEELDLHTENETNAESEAAADEAVDQIKKDVGSEPAEKAKEFDLDKERDRAIDNIKKRVEDGAPPEDLTAFIRKLAENFVRRGVNERNALVDAVHGVIKEIAPEMDRRQVMDAISGYGDFKPLDPDAVKAQLRDLKGQMQQVAKLEDMQGGSAPAKTGVEHRTPSDEERRLIKQVNEMKRKGGFNVTDPAKQLKSALDGIKTRLTNQIADLTHQIETRTRIVKDKTKTPLDAEALALTKQRDALQEQFNQIFQKPELTDAQRLALAEKAADRQIVELERQIRMQEVFPKGKEPELKSAALDAKRARIEALKQEREYVRETLQPPPLPKTETEKTAARLENQIQELERQIKDREVFSKGKKTPETNPEIEAQRQRLAELRQQREHLRDELQPGRFNDQRLGALKSRLTNRIADLQERLANSDFGPRAKRTPVEMDAEAERLQAAATRAKQEFETALLKDRLANRSTLQKMKDTFVKWQRGFLLSGPVTLAKLTAAAATRVTSSIAEEGIGAGLSKVIPEVAKRAPREGGFSLKAEAKAISSALTQGMRDAAQTLKTGRSDLEVNYGKGKDGAVRESDVLPRTMIDFFGALHGALKAPVKRAEFERSLQKRIEQYLANNADVSDPAVQMKAMLETFKQEAYKDASRSIFLQDNVLVEGINSFIARLEQPLKSTGKPSPAGTVGAGVARGLFPIVRVPLNIVAETVQYAVGLEVGLGRLGLAFRRGIENLQPEQADLIMRDLKKGIIGTAALILGYANADQVGGYYTGEKPKLTDAKFGTIKLFGVNIPSFLLHSPLLEALQIGATMRHVLDKKVRGAEQSVGSAVWMAALGLAEETPFGRSASTVAQLLDPRETAKAGGQIAKSTLVPQLVSSVAEGLDRDAKGVIPRKTEGPLTAIQSGIPGLREDLPVDQRKANRRK